MKRLFIRLGRLWVALVTDDERVMGYWEAVFTGWPQVRVEGAGESGVEADLVLRIYLADALPSEPEGEVVYEEAVAEGPEGLGCLRVYEGEGGAVLVYPERAWVEVPLVAGGEAEGWVTLPVLAYGALEALTFTCLAPMLRRRGYYFLHAFAAAWAGEIVLLLGASGSGKTTTGLSLLLAGWGLVTNDVVLLSAEAEGVVAWPTPCSLSVTAETMALLPVLREVPVQREANRFNQKFNCPVTRMAWLRWGEAGRVRHLVWPRVKVEAGDNRLGRCPRPLALARLLGDSMDRWDGTQQASHLALLTALARGSDAWELTLGGELEGVPKLLQQLLIKEEDHV
ncbi:MAG TPA: hypothetical protein VLL52_09210 [Anaerolineae bacterium]|nr:hypothetical protein [Anaerolineae bacterium]